MDDRISLFKKSLVQCIQYADSLSLSHLLSCKNEKNRFLSEFAEKTALLQSMLSLLPQPWIDIAISYAISQKWLAQQNYNGLFGAQKDAFGVFLKIFQSGGDSSLLPLLYTFCEDLWFAAIHTNNENIEEAARLLNKAFTACITDRQPLECSRKWGAFMTLAKLFRAYFHLAQYKLCKNAIRAMHASELPPIDQVPKSHAVSALFYLGVYYFMEEDFERALLHLAAAYENCLVKVHASQRKILMHYLVPCLLLRARYPKMAFLAKHELDGVYGPIVDALRMGHAARYSQHLLSIRTLLLKTGTYRCFETLFPLLYRNLFCVAFFVDERRCKAPLAVYQRALDVATNPCSHQDPSDGGGGHAMQLAADPRLSAHSVFAVLIDRGLVKGYVSHEKAFIVLSANDPFPTVSWQ